MLGVREVSERPTRGSTPASLASRPQPRSLSPAMECCRASKAEQGNKHPTRAPSCCCSRIVASRRGESQLKSAQAEPRRKSGFTRERGTDNAIPYQVGRGVLDLPPRTDRDLARPRESIDNLGRFISCLLHVASGRGGCRETGQGGNRYQSCKPRSRVITWHAPGASFGLAI